MIGLIVEYGFKKAQGEKLKFTKTSSLVVLTVLTIAALLYLLLRNDDEIVVLDGRDKMRPNFRTDTEHLFSENRPLGATKVKTSPDVFPREQGVRQTKDVSNELGKKKPEESEPQISTTSAQNFGQMGPSQIEDYLAAFTLGQGDSFLNSRDNHIESLKSAGKSDKYLDSLLKHLHGKFRSRFVNSAPNVEGPDYAVELHFLSDTVQVYFVLNGTNYYFHEYKELADELKIGKSGNLPPHIFIELPAKKDYGYLHPMYLQIFVSPRAEVLAATLYNTNQRAKTVSYTASEQFVFTRFE